MNEFDDGNVNKFILIGDLHVGVSPEHYHHITEKFMFDVLPNYMNKYGVDKLIWMGDVFDNRKQPDVNSVRFITNCIDKFLSMYREVDMYMITGNHDVYYKTTNEVTSLDYFNMCFNMDRIHIIKEPTQMYNMLLVPWINKENQQRIMEAVENTTMEYCLGHFEFAGFKQHANDKFLSRGISVSEFRKFKKVISGHIHYSSENGNVLYAGCLFQMNKDDKDDPKKIFFLDTENDIIEPILHGVDIMVDFTITNDFVIPDCVNKKVYIKVAFGVDDKTVEKVVETIRLQQPISVTIYENPNHTKQEINLDYTLQTNKTTLEMLQDYVDKIEDAKIDNNKLYHLLQNYYEKVTLGE